MDFDDTMLMPRRTPAEITAEITLSLKAYPKNCDAWHAKRCRVVETLITSTRARLNIAPIKRRFLKTEKQIQNSWRVSRALQNNAVKARIAILDNPHTTLSQIAKETKIDLWILEEVSMIINTGLQAQIGETPLTTLRKQARAKRTERKDVSRRTRLSIEQIKQWVKLIRDKPANMPLRAFCLQNEIHLQQANRIVQVLRHGDIDKVLSGKQSLWEAYKRVKQTSGKTKTRRAARIKANLELIRNKPKDMSLSAFCRKHNIEKQQANHIVQVLKYGDINKVLSGEQSLWRAYQDAKRTKETNGHNT